MLPDIPAIIKHLDFKTSRSGGKGGQHVNKVESKVELLFDVRHCPVLNEEQREIILNRLQKRIDDAGVLHLVVQASRSQLQNKEAAVKMFSELLKTAFRPRKIRKASRPSAASVQTRLKKKKLHAEKKSQRSIRPRFGE